LWITKDHGSNWADISKGLPKNRWISSITPYQHKEGLVYVTLTGYRFDEFTPFVYKSPDYGKTWTSIAAGLPFEAVNILKEDPKFDNILYVGTDHGLYFSTDGGKSYALFQGHLPNVAIFDMAIQKRENELVIGTHGRSVFIIDLKPIHQLVSSNSKEIQVINTSEIRYNPRLYAWYEGIVNKPRQQILFYTPVDGEVKLEIQNDKGEVIQSWLQIARAGFNQSSWEYGEMGRGQYKVYVYSGNDKGELEFEVK
jgi:photosystem II stability/assembly factor-like uncharacterized protein